MSTFQTLRQLHSLIGHALDHLEVHFKGRNLDWPSLDKSFTPGESESAVAHCVDATNKIVAAAEQLAVTVQRPSFTLFDASMAYHLPACLRFAEQTHVTEILRVAGPEGLHVDEIAKKSDQNAPKMSHALRLLATHHIYREVKPNIFANNRISSFIDTGKSVEEILADPAAKYDNTNGMAAFVDMAGDEMFKASAYLTEAYTDSKTKHSSEPSQAPFRRALSVDLPFFQWLESTNRVRRFGVAMKGTAQWEAPDAILHGFPWASLLPGNNLMVDVGGGIGSLALQIAKAHPNIRMIIQDRPKVIGLGEGLWKAELPDALTSGRVQFQAHDFFEPQPCKNASVFLLRAICHDWPDAFALKILQLLRDAAQPYTKLLLGEYIIPYACADNTDASNLPGAAKTLAPSPLLANFGRANAVAYWIDLTMQTMFHSQERTLSQIVSLLAEAGWKVTNIHRVEDSCFGHITAEIL
ncbi:S-adenosyl-L-methionine-dependent methyltransferase [Hysterangium stoloniferum]|nr:S-adenosyl-L-methionine-dependent methyltransferase [Hysterangium stoloniferum]